MRSLKVFYILIFLMNGHLYAQFTLDVMTKVESEQYIKQKKIKSYTRLDSNFAQNRVDTTFLEFNKEGKRLHLKLNLPNGPFINEDKYDDETGNSVDRRYNEQEQLISNETFTAFNETSGVQFRFLYAYNAKGELIYEMAYRRLNGSWTIYYSQSYFNYQYF